MVRIASQTLKLSAATALLALASGCDQDNDTARAIRQARQQLTALHAGARTPQDPALRQSQYEQTIQSLRAVSSQGSDSQQASANLLLGTAQAALAQIAASESIDLEHDASSQLGLLQAQFEHLVVSLRQSAQIITSVDSTNEQRAVERDRQTLQATHAAAADAVLEMATRIESHTRDAQTAKDGSNEFREQEGNLRTQMLQATGQQRADLTVAAVQAQRQADAFDLQGASADTQIALLEPQLEQLEQKVKRIETQLANLSATQQQMQAIDAIRQQSASDALQIAQNASQDIADSIVALDTYRTSTLADAYDNALSRFNEALNALRRASNNADLGSTTKITVGSINQSIAQLLQRRAAGLEQYASLLESMSDPAHNLPNATLLQQYAARVRDSQAQTLQDATDATSLAISAYRSARVQGQAQQRLNRLVEQLEASTNSQ